MCFALAWESEMTAAAALTLVAGHGAAAVLEEKERAPALALSGSEWMVQE